MNLYRIQIGRTTKKGKFEELTAVFVKTEADQTKVANLFRKRYPEFNTYVNEVTEIEELKQPDGVLITSEHLGYDQTISFDRDSLPKAVQEAAKKFEEAQAIQNEAKKTIKEEMSGILTNDSYFNTVSSKTISFRGRLKTSILKNVKPEETQNGQNV